MVALACYFMFNPLTYLVQNLNEEMQLLLIDDVPLRIDSSPF